MAGQTSNILSLHGQLLNESALVDSGSMFNLNTQTRTFTSDQGFFDILAKDKDTLLILSPAFKSKKVILQGKDLAKTLFVVNLESQSTLLKEVLVKGKIEIKPAIGNTQ